MKRQIILLICFLVFTSCKKDDVICEFPPIEHVKIGGINQAISIRGNDLSKPLLLILHGGPGYAMLPLFHMLLPELEDHFIVVNWDQRGAGRSYSGDIASSSMTLKQAIADAKELTEVLKVRFGKEKIYLLGHSWGTILGVHLIKAFPKAYAAYIGVGQVVNVVKNEQNSYAFALEQAVNNSNRKAIKELESIGAPNSAGEYRDDIGYGVTNKWMEFYGGSLYGKTSSDEVIDLVLSDEVYFDHIDQWSDGYDFSQFLFDDANVWSFDFAKTHLKLSVPVYIFMGHHDYDTPFILVEAYYGAIEAPEKQLVWFENSAHFPFYEEKEKFLSELIRVSDNH
ncbi:alpha/beta hydrolase [Marinilabiliaceae bacterium JC017]|nr:alpha/beta hydrolase [Marinilabiliaceae bacterium JC017]